MATSTIKLGNGGYTTLGEYKLTGSNSIDITSFINNYSELLFLSRRKTEVRYTAPVILPTTLFKGWNDGSWTFETGGYASSSANAGDRFRITKASNTYSLGGSGVWSYREGSAGNLVIRVFGK